ncbi:MAG: STAS domain-containing protein [Tabrizicola sp.]|nr:STAS domain-containing protein [Tabrizicola sp.]
MQLKTVTRHNMLVVHVMQDRIDAACALEFKEAMREATAAPSARIVLDLAQVQFLDSSGLGAVVAVMKLLAPNRQLELSGLTATVAKVFRLTRMDTIFTIHTSIEDAARHAVRA